MDKDKLFNNTFFNFLFGFVVILSISLGVIFAVNYYDVTVNDVKQAFGWDIVQSAAAGLFGK
ncbi:MAG: hypothetical protein Q8P16_00920 [bacterium]|nr:hypothetical protein [bacterium]